MHPDSSERQAPARDSVGIEGAARGVLASPAYLFI